MRTITALVLALGLAALAAPPASAAPMVDPPSGYTKLVNLNSDKCADVENWSKDEGAVVHQWSCRLDNDANQWWGFAPSGVPGYWNVVNLNSNMCLDVDGPSDADRAVIHQWHCYNGPSQQWRLDDAGGGYFKLVDRNSGKCMDVDNWSTADGATIHQWSCREVNDANQKWRFFTTT
ncbi:RICIN domain-containing protein [Streptacidiphilus sp. EB129]|uniref:RICIN domain-containing protein n=1 Tax=Streptacidiphilus sp. EB129 TaxID=3156262 RepID=UPI003511F10A